jgi:integrase
VRKRDVAEAPLYKRGEVWWAWILGERRSTGCRDKEAARRRARELEREAADPERVAKAQAGLSDALGLLIADTTSKANAKPPRASRATIAFHQKEAAVLLGALAPEWDSERRDRSKDLPLRQVTAPTVDEYIARRRNGGAKDTTIHKDLSTWRKAMKFAKRAGLWDGDIDRVFPVAFAPEYRPRERWMTPQEWLALVEDSEALDQPDSRRAEVKAARRATLAMVAFMVATSAEWGAVERARPEDIGEDLAIVHVRGSKDAQKGGNRDRFVPIVLLGHAFLLAFAREHADGGCVLLFRSHANFRRALAAACDRAKIGRLSPNDLRRSHAQWLRRAGVRPADIAPVLGHADSRMAERIYGKVKSAELGPILSAQIAAHAAALNPPYKCDTVPGKSARLSGRAATRGGLKIPVSAVRFRLWARRFSGDAGSRLCQECLGELVPQRCSGVRGSVSGLGRTRSRVRRGAERARRGRERASEQNFG